MKKVALLLTFSVVFGSAVFSQSLPADSLFLGQTPPGNIPKVFKLAVTLGHFAAERIAISNDNKEIYYSEIKGYYPTIGHRIKKYIYSDNKWNGALDLFEGYVAPGLSITGDTMYFEGGVFETYFSTKEGSKWSNPKRMVTKVDSAHYLQVTNKKNFYVSARPQNTIGIGDWCKININGSDTTAIGLGMPLNTVSDNLDFFISRDETFMIVVEPWGFGKLWGLGISYHKKDGSWTNPRNLGSKINFGLGMWGPFVTSDNKYLFYTTGTKEDYSDLNVYWVRVDGLIDSLKYTNISPYVKNRLKNQSGLVGELFSFTVPEDTFFDEDSNIPFTYSATLLNGNPLPSWLSFNPSTRVFSGIPTETGLINIKVVATDNAKGSSACLLQIQLTSNQRK